MDEENISDDVEDMMIDMFNAPPPLFRRGY